MKRNSLIIYVIFMLGLVCNHLGLTAHASRISAHTVWEDIYKERKESCLKHGGGKVCLNPCYVTQRERIMRPYDPYGCVQRGGGSACYKPLKEQQKCASFDQNNYYK